jgi:Flp pilus assembly protein TadG
MRNLIPSPARPLLRLLGRDDTGTVGVLVAILISGGVLVGVGALVLDVGQLYQNRAELQNGADAAALAVAKSCTTGTCVPSLAPQYASANASNLTGNQAAVDLVCGSGSLGGCPASTGAMTDCPAAAAGVNYVDVRTSTKTPSGSVLPPVLARALLGNSSYTGTTVRACAQAQWGAPSTAHTIALTISACEWDQATNQGVSFAPPPPYPPNPLPTASFDRVIQLHGGNGNTTSNTGCPTEPAGADGPGNFSWTSDAGTCTVSISNNTYGGNTGNNVSAACQTALQNAYNNKTEIFVPVYVSITGTGSNATYTLKGFAAFVVTGYHMPSFSATDWLNPTNDCKGSNFCLNGYFTQGLITSGGSVGGTNLGAYVVALTG